MCAISKILGLNPESKIVKHLFMRYRRVNDLTTRHTTTHWRARVDTHVNEWRLIALYVYALLIIIIICYYGARARAGGTCLVAVLHAASVIGCWGRAAGATSVIVCW